MHRSSRLAVEAMTEAALHERALTLLSWARYGSYDRISERDAHLDEAKAIVIELRDRGQQLHFL
jgi:hypothetical protein